MWVPDCHVPVTAEHSFSLLASREGHQHHQISLDSCRLGLGAGGTSPFTEAGREAPAAFRLWGSHVDVHTAQQLFPSPQQYHSHCSASFTARPHQSTSHRMSPPLPSASSWSEPSPQPSPAAPPVLLHHSSQQAVTPHHGSPEQVSCSWHLSRVRGELCHPAGLWLLEARSVPAVGEPHPAATCGNTAPACLTAGLAFPIWGELLFTQR